MRHYQQEGLYTRCAIVAELSKTLLDTMRDYNPRVDSLRRISLDDMVANPELLAGEFVYSGPKGMQIRMRPAGYSEGISLTGRPGASNYRWVYLMEVELRKAIIGVNALSLDTLPADEIIEDILRSTGIQELESTPQDVERYMRKRIA